ncbi:MAG: AAA family ATPase [Clostridia bacterium]|nr:AAA family ATPase [Clostridia bacterium]
MNDKTIIIMIGIQGSGKSTFCNKFLENYKRINLDTLKTRHREQTEIDECFKADESFVVDNTNPTKEERARYISQAKTEEYKVVGYFMESKIKDCIDRNNKRTGNACVPAKAIAATSNKLQLPRYDEGFDQLYFVKNDGTEMTVYEWRDENEI